MFRNKGQRGMVTIFFSCGAKPLAYWETHIKNGYIQRFLDPEIKSTVFEIGGVNVSTTYMICPKGNTVLGINMPFLVMVVKNLKKYFSFEVTILDETGMRRRFRASNFQSTTSIQPMCTAMPIGLTDGWNQIQFNLAEFTKRAYQKQFIEVQKVKINANIRLRRIYFAERLLAEDQLPAEYKLFFPLASKNVKPKREEPKTEEVVVTEERRSSKDVSASRGSIHSKRPSQQMVPEIQTAEQMAVPEEISEAPAEVAAEEMLLEGEQRVTELEGEELPEGEQKDIIEVVDEEGAAEEDRVPLVEGEEVSPLELPEDTEPPSTGQDVGDSLPPLETSTSMPENEQTPKTEDVDVNAEIAPDTNALDSEAPDTEAPDTKAPDTEAPYTDAPYTDAPDTDAPDTEAPVTEAPDTEAPNTDELSPGALGIEDSRIDVPPVTVSIRKMETIPEQPSEMEAASLPDAEERV